MPELSDFELRSMPRIWRWYDQSARQLAFRAQTRAEAEAWQTSLREVLTGLLGAKPGAPGDLTTQQIESIKQPGFTRELIVIQTFAGEYMPCYVLIPDDAPRPYKPVIALHGHGTWGAQGLVGIGDTDLNFEPVREMNADYARQLALRGYLVFAPVLRGFAERLEDAEAGAPHAWQSSCKSLGMNALLGGETLLGLRVWDVMRLIDYVQSRDDVMADRLGCVGLSGGGTVTLFTAALDQRITCAVVSGYLNTFRQSIMSIDHCVCNYIPGILRYTEMADIAGLIVPRPLLVESGLSDPIYPEAGTRKALDELRPIYNMFEADDRLDADLFEGGHKWSGAKAYDWLSKWM